MLRKFNMNKQQPQCTLYYNTIYLIINAEDTNMDKVKKRKTKMPIKTNLAN